MNERYEDPIGDIVNFSGRNDTGKTIGQITTKALLALGFCDDTMALLARRLGLTPPGESYATTRSKFPAGKGED